MKAFVLNGFGSVENLIVKEVIVPAVKSDEVLVKAEAISINPVDVKTVKGKGMWGKLKDLEQIILGWDISGTVTEVGTDVKGFKAGDQVFGMVNFPGHGQAYAEYVAAPAAHLALKPAITSHVEAAAASLAALTAYQALVNHTNIKEGDRVLIHAAAGGVGHYAVQIAKHFGAYVIGTSSAENRDFVLGIGADEHVDYKNERFEEVLSDIDFVLDTIGGDNIDRSLEIVKKGGTVISIPSGLSEDVVEKAAAKGVNGYFFLVHSDGHDMAKIASLLKHKVVKSHVSKVFPFVELHAAHNQVATGKTNGKVVVNFN